MRKMVGVLLIAALALSLAACGGAGGSGSGPVKLVMWNSFLFGPNESKMDKKDWYITQAIERFKKANPKIDVEVSTMSDDMEVINKFKAAGVAQNGPDVITMWSCSYALAVKQFLMPIDKYITDEDKKVITGWWTVKENLSDTGTPTYGYPNFDSGITCIFYNKDLVKKAGLDFEAAPPKTVDEFYAACAKIKATGVVPIEMSMKDGGGEAFVVPYWFGQVAGGTSKFMDLVQGKTTFSKEPAFLAAAKAEKALYDKGFTNKDILTLEDGEANNRILTGKGAMRIGGTWLISTYAELGDKLGMMTFPDIVAGAPITGTGIGGPGRILGISSYSKNADAAAKFIRFLESKAEMTTYAKYSPGLIPNRTDIKITEVTDNKLLIKQAEWISKGCIVWLDNVMPGEWCAEWFKLAPLYVAGRISDAEYIQKLDAKQAETQGK
jgi:raffinose/stachyose/melibiose transport system substrate-binding protein